MRLEVILRPGQDPKVYDLTTGKDITKQVSKVCINPGMSASAYVYKLNEKDCKYLDEAGEVASIGWVPIEHISGVWHSAGFKPDLLGAAIRLTED